MTELYGHDSSFNLPLEVIAREFGRDAQQDSSAQVKEFTEKYTLWLQGSEFSSQICFVDITFAPVGAGRSNQETTSLIVGSSQEQQREYGRRLTKFLDSPASLAAHRVLVEGLPGF